MQELGVRIKAIPVVDRQEFQNTINAYEKSMKPQIGTQLKLNIDTKELETGISNAMSYVNKTFSNGFKDALKFDWNSKEQIAAVRALETEFVNLKATIKEFKSMSPLLPVKDYKKQIDALEAEFNDLKEAIEDTFSPEQYSNFVDTFGELNKANMFDGVVKSVKETENQINGLTKRTIEFVGQGERIVKVGQKLTDSGWVNATVEVKDNITSLNRQLTQTIKDVGALQEKAQGTDISLRASELLEELKQISVYAPDARQAMNSIKTEVEALDNEYKQLQTPLEQYRKTIKELETAQINLIRDQSLSAGADSPFATRLKENIAALQEKSAALRKSITDTNEAVQADNIYAASQNKVAEEVKKASSAIKNGSQNVKEQRGLWGFLKDDVSRAVEQLTSVSLAYKSIELLNQAMKSAVDTAKQLNEAFMNISMVTLGTKEQTAELASEYAGLAYELSSTLTDVASGADTWLRQGRSLAETTELIRASTVMARIGQLEDAQSTEYLTSALKGYKIAASDAMHVVEALSEVDVKSASSIGELAEAMQRSANVAAQSGVEFERLIGYLATLKDVSQRSAPVVGESRFHALMAA